MRRQVTSYEIELSQRGLKCLYLENVLRTKLQTRANTCMSTRQPTTQATLPTPVNRPHTTFR